MAQIELIHGDCLEFLKHAPEHSYKCIFADFPDNIGLKYKDDPTGDRRPLEDYFNWIDLIINLAMRKCKILFFTYYWKWDVEIKWMLRDVLKYRHPAWSLKQFLWQFKFSQYADSDCAFGFRYMLRLMSPNARISVEEMREPSERQIIGDARAAGLRVPDNIWSFPRVVGNAAERRSWHCTQLNQEMVQRIVAMCCPAPEDVFVDLFEGSGTSLRACKFLNKRHIGVELSKTYIEELEKEHQIKSRQVI